MSRIEQIEQRLNSTSKGEWVLIENVEHDIIFIEMTERPYGDYLREVASDEDYPTKRNDLDFIANSKSDITYLLQELKNK